MTVTRPLFRYFGGKFAIAPWIIENMPPHRAYVEPFGGGGSVLLLKPKSYAEVYNDLDGDICAVFRAIRDDFERLAHYLRHTPFSREEYDLSYQDTADPLERVRRTLVRSWMGFGNSAQRADGKTGFQAMVEKCGSSKSRQWSIWLMALETFKARLAGVVIENRDAIEVIEQQDSDQALFFLDPPYVPETRLSGSYKYEMTREQHETLCTKLLDVRGMVMLCGYANSVYDRLGWHTITRVTQSMASTPRSEVIWLNPAAVAAQNQMGLF